MATGIKHKAVGGILTQAEFENNNTHETDEGVAPATFIVYKESTTYYSRQVSDGTTPYSGATYSTVMQSTIDAVGVLGGGLIYVQAGVYAQTVALVDNGYSNITIQGAGKYATKFDLQSAISGIVATTCNGWVLEDFEIDGNDHEANNHMGVQFVTVNHFRISNLYIHHIAYDSGGSGSGAYGIQVAGTDGVVEKCHVEQIDHGGIMIVGPSVYVDLVECYGKDNANGTAGSHSSHFNMYGTSGNLVESCNIINGRGDTTLNTGVTIYQYCENCKVIGGSYYNSTTAQVSIGAVAGTNYNIGAIGITAKCAADQHGIKIDDARVTIDGCTVDGRLSASPGSGILILAGGSNCVITGGSIHMDGRPAMTTTVGADWGIVTGVMMFSDSVASIGINHYGDYWRFLGCTVYDFNVNVDFNVGADNNNLSNCNLYTDNDNISDNGAGNIENDNRELIY